MINFMHWIYLIIAGLCEVVWALGLKFSNGLSLNKPLESLVTCIFMILSLYLLAIAARQIPIGISYTVWVGIGTIGTFLGGVFILGDKVNSTQVAFFLMIVTGIIGLKFSSIISSN